ncbi:hypothetical protein ACP26L_34660 [Paenibacillus sp. S-38]|uniref:hypothetical protein n=1 Tax=Paenibacillus sp. S-38 TaxID=3416710 RepID=UPI003CF366CC
MAASRQKPVPSIVWGLLLLALLWTGLYYSQMLDLTYAGVTVVSKGENRVVLRREDGSLQTVSAEEKELRSMTVGEKYIVTYGHNRLRRPFLMKVEPYPE